ncbi:MAG: lactate utilization protein [Desulfobulbaceae bacterium]|nr:MAG: lactate utilization protein [Desulfobulbaceae bacterium]
MSDFLTSYWVKRIERCRAALAANNFATVVADTADDAGRIILDDILPAISPRSASWGDSMTLHATGVLERLAAEGNIGIIRTFEPGVPREEIIERRRRALLVDVFFTGSNAVTEAGQLVNLDMVGNRVAGITFGPRHVIIVAGRNKIVAGLDEAMRRIRDYAAPANAIRHTGWNTPCIKTARCSDCRSPDRICNVWTITEKSYPKGRITVILINQDLGL